MPRLGSIRKFVSGSSKRGSDTAVFHVTTRGGLRVDPGTLFKNSKVLETVDKAAKSDVGLRSPAPPTTSSD